MGIIYSIASAKNADFEKSALWARTVAESAGAKIKISAAAPVALVGQNETFFSGDDITVAVNGFFINRREAAAVAGVADSGDPAELLACLYRRQPEKFIDIVDGSFSFILYDRSARRLIAGVDRFGTHTMFYSQFAGQTIFSEKLDILSSHPDFKREVDPAAVADFLSLQYIPAPETIYRNVKKLFPASVVEVDTDSGEISLRRYWQRHAPEPLEKISDLNAAAEALRELLRDSAAGYGENGGKYGAFLSGGIDSPVTISSVGAAFPERELELYSLGFAEKSYDESGAAKANLAKLVLPEKRWHLYRGSEELLLDFQQYAKVMDEPFGDASLLGAGFLCKVASQDGVKYLYSGDGGDELFGGYDRYRALGIAGALRRVPGLSSAATALLSGLCRAAGERSKVARLRRFFSGIANGKTIPGIYFNWLDRAPEALLQKLFPCRVLPERSRHFAGYRFERKVAKYQEMASILDMEFYLPGDGCTKLKYAATPFDVTILTPFLNRKIADFSDRLPWSFKQDLFHRKKVLARAFADKLAGVCINGAKRGFGIPMAIWLRSDNAYGICRDEFNSGVLATIGIDISQAQGLLDSHRQCGADHSYILWNLFALSLFLRLKRF